MTNYLDLIDRNTAGNRCDVTPLFANAEAFARLLDDLVRLVDGVEFDFVVGVDALGFILATGIALRTAKGLVVARKGGKLPVRADAVSFVDYTGQTKTLEMRPDALKAGVRVLIVDEWIETGAQVSAVIELVENRGAIVACIASINIDADAAPLVRKYPCFSLMK